MYNGWNSCKQLREAYGKEAFEFVTIPFEKRYLKVGDKFLDKEKNLNSTRRWILKEMRNNPNITQQQLMGIVGIGKTAIQSNISYLRKNGYLERIGSNKNGYWKVL